jgi:hypothetical protein
VKAGTAAALVTDHEREAAARRIPYLDVLDGSDNAAELQGLNTGQQEHHPSHSKAAMQKAAKTATPLIIANVSSPSLDIEHPTRRPPVARLAR